MSDDLTEAPCRWRFPKLLDAALVVVLLILVLIMALHFWPSSPAAQAPRPVWNGRLADVTGDDELYRLRVTQAAIRHELAFLGEWMTEGDGGLPDTDLARVPGLLNARQDELDGVVAHLSERQDSLEDLAFRCRFELAEQSERLSDLSRVLEAPLEEERN